ncbi:MAG: 5-formyltetrahydrofolate cyclo-ligase [Deltaproteobacteria bacterium]|nr:5-formyltetrahydrofolate cyclo-ligase [Deltaproteobacteria bacterium]
MEDAKIRKRELRASIREQCEAMPPELFRKKSRQITERLLEFANFVEAQTVLLYHSMECEPDTLPIIKECYEQAKTVVLPTTHPKKQELVTFKVEHPAKELIKGASGRMEPDPRKCKPIPLRFLDLAIVPGLVFDERGGRIGSGFGRWDRLIPQLPGTTRKVSLAMEYQIVPQVPMEPHDRYVDILITEERIIYKI